MDPGSYSHGTTSIASWSSVVLDEGHGCQRSETKCRVYRGRTFERVCIDSERTESCGTTHEIVTSITDNESDVVGSREVDSGLDVLLRLRHNDILGEMTEGALGVTVGGG